ncbi:MAG TPA: hypothetical protein VMS99_00165 [Acidimicrobiia bacterium]|nr:hypothetical protein [Acidimicrobiia bacterium]
MISRSGGSAFALGDGSLTRPEKVLASRSSRVRVGIPIRTLPDIDLTFSEGPVSSPTRMSPDRVAQAIIPTL